MNVILYIDNLAVFITEEELKTLLAQVAEVIASGINKAQINGRQKDRDQRFPTAGINGQFDREVAKFTAYSLNGSTLRARLTMSQGQHNATGQNFEP